MNLDAVRLILSCVVVNYWIGLWDLLTPYAHYSKLQAVERCR
jgi:hypothetical protein